MQLGVTTLIPSGMLPQGSVLTMGINKRTRAFIPISMIAIMEWDKLSRLQVYLVLIIE